MAGKQLKDFDSAGAISDADILYGAQLGAEKKVTRGAAAASPYFATFAALTAALAAGQLTLPRLVMVTADETKNGTPAMYFIDASGLGYWGAFVRSF